jgi:hypothetical protein
MVAATAAAFSVITAADVAVAGGVCFDDGDGRCAVWVVRWGGVAIAVPTMMR